MMTKKISFIFLCSAGNRVKQFTMPLAFFILLAVAIVSGAALFSIMLYHFIDLRQTVAENDRITRRLADQSEEVAHQRLQIQSFAHDIDDLKNKLVRLNQFEEKIRVIANLNPGHDENALFGVGGAAPEDLDPRLKVSRRHEHLMRQMHRQVNELESASVHQEQRFGRLMDRLEDQRSLLASTPAIWPTKGWTTSGFGYRTSPFTGRREFHKGLDISNRKGTTVQAAADGVVTFAGRKGSMGKMVVIDHGHGLVTRYAHLSETLKKKGETVNRGDIIAKMGNTGRSTGPHLHYEVHLDGVPVNPSAYILN
jgi:murein DD-endopeptidase MepM/ murein hydrolase activator NlpD